MNHRPADSFVNRYRGPVAFFSGPRGFFSRSPTTDRPPSLQLFLFVFTLFVFRIDRSAFNGSSLDARNTRRRTAAYASGRSRRAAPSYFPVSTPPKTTAFGVRVWKTDGGPLLSCVRVAAKVHPRENVIDPRGSMRPSGEQS